MYGAFQPRNTGFCLVTVEKLLKSNLVENNLAINKFTVTTSFKDSRYCPFSNYFLKKLNASNYFKTSRQLNVKRTSRYLNENLSILRVHWVIFNEIFTSIAYVNPISNLDGIIKCQGKSHFEADNNSRQIIEFSNSIQLKKFEQKLKYRL